jgi:hypothetical protein
MEKDVYDFLKDKQVIFYYEFMEFYLPQTNPDVSLTYKPDFLLPKLTYNGKKLLLEPHGVKTKLPEFLDKLTTFRQQYGDYFCLILIVPDELLGTIDLIDPQHKAYDFVWKRSNYKIQLETFHST